jgi:hypothetical protein
MIKTTMHSNYYKKRLRNKQTQKEMEWLCILLISVTYHPAPDAFYMTNKL